MNLADYLIGNSDEHPDNWGFLYDNDMNITGMNPLMDYDHAFESTPITICTPALFTRGRISQEQMAKDIIEEHPDWLDYDMDLSEFKYGNFTKERLITLKEYLMEKGLYQTNDIYIDESER